MSPSLTGPGSWMPENTSNGPLGVPVPRETKARGREAVFLSPRSAAEMNGVQAHSPNNGVGPCGNSSTPFTANIAGPAFPRCASSVWLAEHTGLGIAACRSSRALAPSGVGVKGCARLLPRGGAVPS